MSFTIQSNIRILLLGTQYTILSGKCLSQAESPITSHVIFEIPAYPSAPIEVMGGSEGSNSDSGGDGGRSGYDVTRVAPMTTLTKAAGLRGFRYHDDGTLPIYLFPSICLFPSSGSRQRLFVRKRIGPGHGRSDTSHKAGRRFIESTILIIRNLAQLFMIVLVLGDKYTWDNLTDVAWDDL